MEMKEFTTAICEELRRQLGANYSVMAHEVQRNNNVRLQGLLIQAKEQNVSPTIYLDYFLKAYKDGLTIPQVAEQIIRIYNRDMPEENVNLEFFKEFHKVQNRICYRLISAERNKELLEKIPHIPFLDLAITFYYAYRGKELGNGSIPIYNSHMEMWNTDTKELMRLAVENTEQLFPWECRSLDAVMKEYQPEYCFAEMPLKVLTNKKRVHGAACILYPELLEIFACQMRDNLYILPSSVHEVLLVAESEIEEPVLLYQMVQEVNSTQVEPEEVLSDKIYFYNRSEKNIKIVF